MGYTDAKWESNIVDRKITSGCYFNMGLGFVSWYTRKKKSMELSFAEVEYIAMSMATCEAIWIWKLLVAFFG